jgi:hypothetical protein
MIPASMIRSNTRDELSYLLPGALFFILRLSCTQSHKKLGVDHLFIRMIGSPPSLLHFCRHIFFYFFLFWVKMVQLVESRNGGLSASAETPTRTD